MVSAAARMLCKSTNVAPVYIASAARDTSKLQNSPLRFSRLSHRKQKPILIEMGCTAWFSLPHLEVITPAKAFNQIIEF
jgi:hypothetical protein